MNLWYNESVKNLTKFLLVLLIPTLFISSSNFSNAAKDKDDPWKKWLDEVHLIITKTEKSVFESLQTEEDKKKFQELFWRARDPKPETPQNEYKMEFYRRHTYAETDLDGPNSDRGRIYIFLGDPFERKDYSGYDDVVDCELWIYHREGRPELPPFMYLLFYRPNNFGRYRQYHPGAHSAKDIISPGYLIEDTSIYEAYRQIRGIHTELAQATVSIIPGEAESTPMMGQPLTSSATVLTQIYTLPEREVERTYLKNFASLEGIVDVTYSAKEIGGKGLISISENKGFKFLNYSIMPDVIATRKIAENSHNVNASINLRIEDLEGKTIHQQERNINIEFDEAEKKAVLEERKIVFKDFAPIVEGEYDVSVTFSNKNKEGHFVHRERISITEDTVPILVGSQITEINPDKFLPFSSDGHKVATDPRLIFNKNELLTGLIFSEQKPSILLQSIMDENNSIEITNVEKQGNSYLFRLLLENIKSDNYYLSIKNENGEVYRKIISVMPFLVQKPVDFEKAEDASADNNYIFVIARQYFNKGEIDKSIEFFNKLPENQWNSKTIPSIAQAYYVKKDYEKVLELLERENIIIDYPVLVLLGNSSLKLKRNQKAAEYFETLRKYGDTAEINRVLGAIYFSLGDKEKAEIYWERAKKLEKTKKKNLDHRANFQ